MTAPLELWPAIDLMDGQAVQLVQGEAGSVKRFGDPLAAAARWADAGARWLHVVDLDAAFGRGSNADVVAAMVAASPMDVQISGGVRDDASLGRALDTGCAWVSVGTAAIERPDWCADVLARYADRVAISIDVRDGRLAGRGWTTEGEDALEAVTRLSGQGCRRFIVTDVGRDGTLGGPNLDLLRQVCARTDASVIASGGVSSLADIAALRGVVRGAIVGTALYVGRIDLAEALRVAEYDA
jgi:phosphoribosylanthranilate isomerase